MAKSSFSPRHKALRALLIQARRDAGKSQVELATLLRKPQSYVSKFETGERRLDVVELLDITEVLGQSAVAIVEALLAIQA